MTEKVTIMVLKVDLECKKCSKKVKKVLCKFPEIQDQTYDEKQNTVTIKVVSCCPEKLRDKICCKGGDSIKSIEIKSPEKPKESEKKKEPEKTKETEKKKEPEKTKEKPADKPKSPPKALVPVLVPVPVPIRGLDCCSKCHKGHCGELCHPPSPIRDRDCCRECSVGHGGGPCYHPFPAVCCRECDEGWRGGPCYHLGCEQMRYCDGYCRSPVYGSLYGGGRSWCKDYVYEETPSAACIIM